MDFSIENLKNLITNEQITEAKNYVKQYFFKLKDPVMTVLKTPSRTVYTFYSQSQVCNIFLQNNFGKDTDANFKVADWFYQKDIDYYIMDINPTESSIWNKKGSKYLNMFYGYLHKNKKAYSSYSEEIRNKVNRIWEHIRIAWCSRKESQFQYVKSWMTAIVAGKKMKSLLYLKTIPGIGKGVITEFIRDKVIGRHAVHETKNIDCIIGKFNKELMGKVLLILEEVPAETKSQWNTLTNAIKTVVTNNVMEIEPKGKDKLTIDNYLNVIVLSNNNAMKIDNNDRRIFVLDISNEFVGNVEYFTKLCSECTENDEVGEAFYWYCIEHSENNKDFKSNVFPESEAKQEIIIDNLNIVYKFIKDNYVLRNKGIAQTFKDFYTEYVTYTERNKIGFKVSNVVVSKLLKDINIPIVTKGGNRKKIEITKETLLDIYQKRKWILDIDEFEQTNNTKKNKNICNIEVNLDEVPESDLKILRKYMFIDDEDDE